MVLKLLDTFMNSLEKIKALKAYLDKLEESFCVQSSTDIEDALADYETGEIKIEYLDEIYEKLNEIELEFPEEPDSLYYSRDEFEAYMVEIDTIVEVDKSTVRTKHFRQTIIECERSGWYAVMNKLKSYRFVDENYDVSVIENPFLIGLINSKNKNYDEDCGLFPCSSYLALELKYKTDAFLKNMDENALMERILYYLSQQLHCAVYISESCDADTISDDLYDCEASPEEEEVDVKSLLSFTPLTRLYTRALEAVDNEIRFLYFYKIIEHISPVVAKLKAYKELNKRLDLLSTCRRDYKYLDSIFDICRKYDEDMKDEYLCASVIQECIDVVSLWPYLPEGKVNQYKGNLKLNIPKGATPSDKDFDDGKLQSYKKQLARSLYSTRNSIVHAKSNYEANGTEFAPGEMQEANKIMEIIASTIIQWNERQADAYKIQEERN